MPGLDVTARYIPGTDVGVGGDWYDLFPLPSGHVGVAIGDVAGNGLRAAVVMGRIRSALRAYALETNDPADVLTRLDRKLQLFEPDIMATAIYTVINPAHTTATMSIAGHLPPVLINTTGKPELLNSPPDPPLGAHLGTTRRTIATELPQDSALLFYTDGLIERRDRPLSQGIHKLLDTLTADDAEDLCTRVVTSLLHDQAPGDDVAILVVHRSDSSSPHSATH